MTNNRARKEREFNGMTTPRLVVIFCVASLLGLGTLSAALNSSAAARETLSSEVTAVSQVSSGEEISESALRQIRAFLAEKESRSETQQKIDSQLLYAINLNRGQNVLADAVGLDLSLVTFQGGKTIVAMTALVTHSLVILRNTNSLGAPDLIISFGDGPGGDLPIAAHDLFPEEEQPQITRERIAKILMHCKATPGKSAARVIGPQELQVLASVLKVSIEWLVGRDLVLWDPSTDPRRASHILAGLLSLAQAVDHIPDSWRKPKRATKFFKKPEK